MSEEKKDGSAGNAGSPEGLVGDNPPNPNDLGGDNLGKDGGKSSSTDKNEINMDDYIEKSQYKEAEKKISEQGEELGNNRKFLKEISPLLDKLRDKPEIIEAIVDGKIDATLAQAALDGKISISDANEVNQAHKEIKKDLGKKEYEKTSSEEIEKMVADRVESTLAEKTKELKGMITKSDSKRDYEDKTNVFIKNTSDYGKYAKDINDWLEKHPDQYDISIAYEAVKGREVISAAAKEEEIKEAEAAKELAGNASGGSSQGGKVSEDKDLADQLIAGKGNPNEF